MRITNLLTNHFTNPLGMNIGVPCFSWVVEAEGETAVETRVEVAADGDFATVLYDSGFDAGIDNIAFYADELEMKPRTRYYWRVSVKMNSEVAASEAAWFETAKMDEPWVGEWISPEFADDWHPILSASFTPEKEVVSARAYVCGLGLYEFSLNGSKVGDEQLAPGICAYDKWIPYQTLDLTADIKQGVNSIEIELGNGWYKGRYGIMNKNFRYGEEFACVCEVVLTFADGLTQVVATDISWKAKRSNIDDSSIFDGEYRDDTKRYVEVYPVKKVEIKSAFDGTTPVLQARRSAPIKIMKRIEPSAIKVITTPLGETVLDMGQNMVGWLEFTCKAPKGTQPHLQFGECLQQGNFYRDNLRTALCEYKYTSDGEQKVIRPKFTFYGFRYVKLTEWHQPVDVNDFKGLVMYTEMRETGNIKTNNSKINRLFLNALWGQFGNFLDTPTDCPQRDERMGWTGDAQVIYGTSAFNLDVCSFFDKYYYDLMQEQKALDGCVPVVIPKHDVHQTGACAWADAATIIPWKQYVQFGDKRMLARHYEGMKAWVDYLYRRDEKFGSERLWKNDFHYGDWLALDNEDPIGNRFGGTDRVYIASCFYRYSSMLTAKAARVLGYTEDAERFEKLSEQVRQAICEAFVTAKGKLAINTQTAHVVALFMDILPEQWREQTAHALRLKLKDTNYHLRTGFIGVSYLNRVLSNTGSNDIAYRLLMQEDFPSWLYQVNMGATTIWERWNSILPDGSISDTGMNSLNHYSYGSVVEWMYRDVCGLVPLEEYPAFRKFRLAPKPNKALGFVEMEYNSPVGLIKSAWKYQENDELELNFTVPFGATAELELPEYTGDAPAVLTCGTHTFRYLPTTANLPKINLETPMSVIQKNLPVRKIFEAEFPELPRMMLFYMLAGEKSLNDLKREGLCDFTEEQGMAVCERMSNA